MARPTDSLDWNYDAPLVINVFFGAAGVAVSSDSDAFTTAASGWTVAEKAQAMKAFEAFETVANVQFNEVFTMGAADFAMLESKNEGDAVGNFGYWAIGGGDLTYGGVLYSALDGWGVFNSDDDGSGTEGDAGDSWSDANLAVGAYGYITLIHEIAHGMGLAHPHDSGGGSEIMQGVTSAFGDYGDFNLNQGIFTTMSYNDGWHTAPHVPELNPSSATYGYGWQGTLMALDIAVLQEKYGANMTYNTGDDTYQMPSSNAAGTYYSCIWDAGGTDTIRHDGTSNVRIDLRAATLEYTAIGGGAVSYVDGIYGGFTIANTVVIENAVGGSGDDVLRGNEAVNELNGRDGDDTYYVQQNGDTIIDSSGTDTVNSTVSFTLAANLEKCVLIGGAAINATGNQFANTLTGNGAANQLDGGGGADRMIGNKGNDTYIVNQRQDRVVESANGGRDGVRSTVDFTLGNNVENCSLLGSGDLDATGNRLANTLRGNSGNNVLDGRDGKDKMIGGLGNDVYVVNQRGDNVVERGRGSDTVRSTVDYNLDQGVERCVLVGSSKINAVGNSLDNFLRGNKGGNVLDGGGGKDKMVGGLGNDVYIVNQRGDNVVEKGRGSDTVRSTIDYSLDKAVERCILVGGSKIDATGNSLDNMLRGNRGANVLDGGGGKDKMVGGLGNDVYIVNQRGDSVVEKGRGTDTVRSTVDYTLDKGVERCMLLGKSGADATGNNLVNTLLGNNGNNTLKALGGSDALNGGGGRDILMGGIGSDNLNGGTGADVFDFNSVSDSTQKPRGRDFIGDFSRKQGDKINLAQIDADGSLAGNGQFKFIGKDAFSSDGDRVDDSRAELRYFHTSSRDTIIQGDTNGDRIADFSIVVDGRMNFTQGDFVL